MKYYFFSFIIAIIIFIIIQYLEYNKQKAENELEQEPYNLFTIANLLLFIIIYLVVTIGLFYLNASNINLFSFLELPNKTSTNGGNINQDVKEDIDPKILSKINDNFDIGFAPFASDDDASSLSSMSSIETK